MQNFAYRYLSDGTKVSVTDKNGNGFLYLGSARFSCGANGTEFESLPFSGGRIVNSSNGCRPQYHLTDHLGSTRVVAAYDNEWTDIERRNYTPFGKEWETPFFPTSENNFTFSGKEKQTLGNIGFLDFGARLYDPEGGIFLQQDPLAEKYSHIGQYCYCAGNPIKFIDPDGKDYKIIINNRNQTITLKQTLYASINSRESALTAAKFWNDLSDYKYIDKQGTIYKVKFSVNVRTTSMPKQDAKHDISGNSYTVNDISQVPNSNKVNGKTVDHKYVVVDSTRSNLDTGAHEVGHTFNMKHSTSGIMTPASNDPNRNNTVTQENINQAIESSTNIEHINSILDELKNFFSTVFSNN